MIDFSKRTCTSFGVSIGTGLMLESLFSPIAPRYDETREIPNKLDVSKYTYHFYNLMTLARNICTSFETKLDITVFLKDRGFSECLNEEVNAIQNLYSDTRCKPMFYYNNYEKLFKRLNVGKDRDKTVPIIANEHIYKALKDMKIKTNWLIDSDYILEDVEKLPIIPSEKKCLLTTSFNIDTFARMNLSILDSHTGVLYEKPMFYKKYYQIGSKDMSIFPHYEILLYYLGDITMSKIINPGVRATLYKVALENGWNTKTSKYIVETCIKKDPTLRPFFNNYKPLY